MPLRNIIEQATQYKEGLSHAERIEAGRKKLFDFKYDFYDEEYRSVFETNFIRKFYFTEIGFETEGQFKFQLETWLRLNMHYYNRLFESELFDYDPLVNYDVQTTYNRENTLNQGDKTSRNEKNKLTQDATGTSNEDHVANETMDTNEVGKENVKGNVKGDTTGQTDTDSTNNSTRGHSSEVTNDGTEFNRQLNTDTPNERLQITANNNGTGIINYASSIEENSQNLNNTTNGREDTTNRETGTVGTSDTRNSNEDSTRDTDQQKQTDTDRNLTTNTTGRTTNNQNSDSNTDETSSLDRNVNNVEDFIERRYGSAGVKTYPELIEGYRNSLLRVEVMMFDEMRPKLFMGLY